jgi:MFS family permease
VTLRGDAAASSALESHSSSAVVLRTPVILLASAFFLDAFAVGLSSLDQGWYGLQAGSVLPAVAPVWVVLWQIAGVLFFGRYSDLRGRRDAFLYEAAACLVAALGLTISYNGYIVLGFDALLLFGAGGLANTALVMAQEGVPSSRRSASSYMTVNFGNLAGLTIGSLALYGGFGEIGFQRELAGFAAAIGACLLVFGSRGLRESTQWLDTPSKGKGLRKEFTWLRYLACVSMGIPIALGIDFFTTWLGPNFFPNLASSIVAVAYAVAFSAGLVMTVLARTGRRLVLLTSFAGASLSAIAAYALVPAWAADALLFWSLLVIVAALSSAAYLAANTFMAEVWTESRGTMLALVKASSLFVVASVLLLRQGMDIYQYAILCVSVWTLGLAGAASWYILGYETAEGGGHGTQGLETGGRPTPEGA